MVRKQIIPEERTGSSPEWSVLVGEWRMVTPLPSSARQRMLACRRDLVLELVLERGGFWERIQAIRRRWTITPIRQLPPPLTVGRIDLAAADVVYCPPA